MPKSMRPVVKLEDGEAKGQGTEGLQEEAVAGRAVQRRRVGEAGDVDEALLLRLNMEAQAQAIQGMERARMLGEELLQAKARVAELAAELKMRDEALRSIIESKDAVIPPHSSRGYRAAQRWLCCRRRCSSVRARATCTC
jgi:hypothetical protein